MSSNIISGYKFSRNSQLPPPTHVNGLPKGWHVIALGDFNLEDSEVCHITCLAIMESSQMDHLKWPLGPRDYWGQDRSRFQDFQDHFTPWKKLVHLYQKVWNMISEFQGDRVLNTSSRGCPNFASFFSNKFMQVFNLCRGKCSGESTANGNCTMEKPCTMEVK